MKLNNFFEKNKLYTKTKFYLTQKSHGTLKIIIEIKDIKKYLMERYFNMLVT